MGLVIAAASGRAIAVQAILLFWAFLAASSGAFFAKLAADEMRSTSEATAKAANATETAANAALLALDRPWPYLEDLRCVATEPRPGIEQLVAGFRLANHGKAPALIHSVKAVLFYSPGEFFRDVFPIKPLPQTMLDFPAGHNVRMLIEQRGRLAMTEIADAQSGGVGTLAPMLFANGIVIGQGEVSTEFMFRGDREIRLDYEDSIPAEHAGNIYLIGCVSYVTPYDEPELIYFCFEAEHGHRQFRRWGGKPFNEWIKAPREQSDGR